MKIRLLACLLLTAVAYPAIGTAASPKIDEAALAAMRKGQTTFDEIVRRFGRPNFGSKNWDGTRTAAYAYGEGWTPGALSALGAALGGSTADTVVLNFNERDVLTDYRINQAAKPGEAAAAAVPATRYVEPSFAGTKPAPAAKPAAAALPAAPAMRYLEPSPAGAPPHAARPAAAAATQVDATPPAPVPASKPVTTPAPRNDGLPSWLPPSSTRGADRY